MESSWNIDANIEDINGKFMEYEWDNGILFLRIYIYNWDMNGNIP